MQKQSDRIAAQAARRSPGSGAARITALLLQIGTGMLIAASAIAQPSVSTLATTTAGTEAATTTAATAAIARRYPANSIDSVATADAALADASRQRVLVEAQHARDEYDCADKFFMTRCLDGARERRRVALATLRSIEIEANAFKRRARVADRDRTLEQKRMKTEQEPAPQQRVLRSESPAAPLTAPPTAPAAPAAPTGAGSPPPGPSSRALQQRAPAEPSGPPRQARPRTPSIDPATEARNIAAFEKKAAESARRQRKVAERKAAKERERAEKNAKNAAAAAAATTPVSPPKP